MNNRNRSDAPADGRMDMEATEFFSLDENGRMTDAHLHADMLDNPDPEMERLGLKEARKWAFRQGWDRGSIDRLWSLPRRSRARRPKP